MSPMEFNKDSLQQLEEYLKSHPDDAEAWNVHGVILANMGEFGPALRSLDHAIKLNPRLVAAHLNKGRVLLTLGPEKARDALVSLKKALALDPNSVEILVDLARALGALGRTREEKQALLRVVRERRDVWQIWVRLGDICIENGEFKEALKYYDTALKIKDDMVPVLLHQAIAYSMLDKVKNAISAAERAVKLAPDDATAWHVLADIHIRAERFRSARNALERARQLDPSDLSIIFTLGLVEYKDGHLKEAAKYFRAVLKRDHKHVRALHNLALVLMDLEDWKAAAEIWNRLSSIIKDSPSIFDAKATVYAKLKDYCAAHQAWERARKLYKKKGDDVNAIRVAELARAARINCSRQKKAERAEREHKRMTRSFDDRFELRRKKKKK